MFNVYLLNYGKNHKSTEQPDVSNSTPVKMKLKAPSSILSPVMEMYINPSNQGSWVTANYAYIPDFNRYYYITNTTLNGQLVSLSMSVDVLASFKTAITGSTQYVLRAASNYDGTIKDTKYPIKAVNPNHSITYGDQKPNPLQPASASYGCFVVGVVNKGGSLAGCVSYYAMSYLVFIDFMNKLFNLPTQWGTGGTDLADGLKKAITDPMQYVVSAMWYPYSVNDFVNRSFASGSYYITVGYDTITLGAVCYPFDNVLNIEFTNMISFTLPDHPQAASRGSYLNFEPYSKYYLSFYPFCSLCEIDSTKIGGKGTVYCVYTVDLRSGKGNLSVCTEINGTTYTDWTPKSPIRVFEAQVGVPIPVATIHTELQNLSQYLTNAGIAAVNEFGGFEQTQTKVVNTASNAVMKVLAKLFNSDDLMEATEQAETTMDMIQTGDLSKIASNAAAMKSTCEMIGSQGTMSMFNRMPIAMWGDFYTVADDNLTKFGRPLCKTVALNTLSGFVQCDTPFCAGAGMTLTEQCQLERMLAEGVYIA